ncbi:phosphoesterase [Sporanaerobium hydrogeniformans]|uniref:Phosphoesterase n=1 Tax=Sporanaerobium hydrogeniformans TaxID=3072179 RepID=A0AC61DDZ3_9FIRM|nr:PHP domain-containing protein [Sporanaerobium hydrogeniformans]PHV71033.1 phosphoesterase [Sporanaerobium hydrogeniformans]
MKLAYDFHIHTAASPCGDQWMSPHNIVNMALLNGLDAIAITDHNTCANCASVMKVGRAKGLLVIPGMEIECQEEFHTIALFPSLEAAYEVERSVKEGLPSLKNRIDIFGNQWKLDEEDEIVGEIDQFLLTATSLTAQEVFRKVREVGGIIYPAHIDRQSYSILSNLGFIPPELGVNAIEISKGAPKEVYERNYINYQLLQSSDAHYLQDISERRHFLSAEACTIYEIFKVIDKKT